MNRDRIEKKILLRAPRKRVWCAVIDSSEFGTWFGESLCSLDENRIDDARR